MRRGLKWIYALLLYTEKQTEDYIHLDSETSAQNQRKQYVPATLHPLTLLCFAILCFGCISAIEASVRTTVLSNKGLNKGTMGKRDELLSIRKNTASGTTIRISNGTIETIITVTNGSITNIEFKAPVITETISDTMTKKFKPLPPAFASDLSLQHHHHNPPITAGEALDPPLTSTQARKISCPTKVARPPNTQHSILQKVGNKDLHHQGRTETSIY